MPAVVRLPVPALAHRVLASAAALRAVGEVLAPARAVPVALRLGTRPPIVIRLENTERFTQYILSSKITWPPLAGEERKHRMLVTMLAMFCVFAWFVCGLHRLSLGPVCEPVNCGALPHLSLKKVPMVSIRSPQSDFHVYLWGKRA